MSLLVDIAGLRFAYGDGREALRGVDLAVAAGEHVVVVGPNGSGKSTLARILAALEEPGAAQRALVCGYELGDPAQQRATRRQAGILFQDPESQVVGATVEEDVAFGLENLGLPAPQIAARVDEMLARFALEDLRRREPHLLSGGQKQRTALAGVLAVPRRLIVLDEPTAMLDARGRQEVLDAVRLLGGQGLTVIAVTQEMDEVPATHRVVALEEGRVVFDGLASRLFADAALVRRLSLGVPVAAEVSLELHAHGVSGLGLPLTVEELAASMADAGIPSAPGRERLTTPRALVEVPAEAGRDVDVPGGGAQAGVRAQAARNPAGGSRGLALRCAGLSFSYREGAAQVRAIADLSLSLDRGSSTALLGPSGAGKSTLLMLVRGLLSPDEGRVLLDGAVAGSPAYRDLQRRVGVVFQRPEIQLFASTVRDDVAFGPRQLGWAETEVKEAVAASLEAVGLPESTYGDRHPYSLSGGEQRRAALAGVLAMRPGMLLLDEPFVSLDPRGRRELADTLQRLKAGGVTLVLATHDVDQAWSLCDERLLLLDGRLLADGPWSFDDAGREVLAAAGMPLPTLVELWRRLDLPPDGAPRTPAQAAALLGDGPLPGDSVLLSDAPLPGDATEIGASLIGEAGEP